jgi:hypothetical protein
MADANTSVTENNSGQTTTSSTSNEVNTSVGNNVNINNDEAGDNRNGGDDDDNNSNNTEAAPQMPAYLSNFLGDLQGFENVLSTIVISELNMEELSYLRSEIERGAHLFANFPLENLASVTDVHGDLEFHLRTIIMITANLHTNLNLLEQEGNRGVNEHNLDDRRDII